MTTNFEELRLPTVKEVFQGRSKLPIIFLLYLKMYGMTLKFLNIDSIRYIFDAIESGRRDKFFNINCS